MEPRPRIHLLAGLVLLVAAVADARVYMTQQQALAAVFPNGAAVKRETFFLTPQQQAAARKQSGIDFKDKLIVRYAGPTGFAYFDTHRVRTLSETIMVVVTNEGAVQRIDVLSFDEPAEYFPKRRWIDQILRRKLDDDLSLNRAIRPMSGASLTARSIVNASRKILALHEVLKR